MESKPFGFSLFYLLSMLLLLGVEILIALFVHDAFVRPYIGDVLAVVWLYSLVRVVWRRPSRWLPAAVFAVGLAVEIAQYAQLIRLLGLEDNRFFRILLGSSFDWADIACYVAGALLTLLWQTAERRKFYQESKK